MAHVRIRSLIAGRLWKFEDRLYFDRVGDAPMTALAKVTGCIFPSIMRAHARTRGNPANPPFAAPTLGGAAVPNRQNRPKWAEIRRSPQRETWFLAGARSFANPGRRVRRGEDRRGHRRDQHVLDASRTYCRPEAWPSCSRTAFLGRRPLSHGRGGNRTYPQKLVFSGGASRPGTDIRIARPGRVAPAH